MKIINDLAGNGVFEFELFDPAVQNRRIFKSQMVQKIKGKSDKPYEKSRLIIQSHTNFEKLEILTQFPTIKLKSYPSILTFAPGLAK